MRLVLYDATCGALTASWIAGTRWHRLTGGIDASFGAKSWEEGLEWLASHPRISEIQYWGHGQQGQVLLDRKVLDARALTPGSGFYGLLGAIRARMTPDAPWWFRTCLTFGGEAGHDFARRWTAFFERPAAGHTWVIGPVQGGFALLRPGEAPHWSVEETSPSGRLPAWARLDAPRAMSCLRLRLPRT